MAEQNEQLSTWLPRDEAEALRDLARRHQRSVSQMIRIAVIAFQVAEQESKPAEVIA